MTVSETRRVGARTVVALGATGMLVSAVVALADAGARVLVVARRPGRVPPRADGHVVSVPGDWDRPDELIRAIAAGAEHRPIGAALLWVHTPHDRAIVPRLGAVLADDAVVVRLRGSADVDPRSAMSGDDVLPGRDVREVVLGYARDGGRTRWLSDAEIAAGALAAFDDPAPLQVVGTLVPWSARPGGLG